MIGRWNNPMMLKTIYFLDWANISLSFFNTIVLLWLGLVILLSSERRRWGTWMGSIGMILASCFFAGHSAVVGRIIGTFTEEMEFWWWFGWLPFISAPFLWYVVIAWYTGVLRENRHHRIWMRVMKLLGAIALALLLFADPLPNYQDIIQRTPSAMVSIGGIIPAAALIYPVYSILCIFLSISALHQPASSDRFMGDLARRRAHPWFVAASFVLLVVSLAVGVAATWFLNAAQTGQLPGLTLETIGLLILFDMGISFLIAVANILIGQAIVSYEIFTGKVLPRGGLRRHWRRTIILAASYSMLLAFSLGFELDPIFRLVLVTLLITVFYAVVSWRSFVTHEQSMLQLRPFVASQRIYERIITPATPAELDSYRPFHALCNEVLNATVAYLSALGPLAPLVGPMLVYPFARQKEQDESPLPINELTTRFPSPQTMCVRIDPTRYGDAVWAVPLWSERGLIGVLLLGTKQDDSLYTQEEIEIAQATGERLIDTQASAEMSRRLMGLQRQRLSESQVLDRRTRRVLHDDVLPQLHTAMLLMSSQPSDANTQAMHLLSEAHRTIADLLHALPATTSAEVGRMGLIGALHRVIDHELGEAFDGVTWQVEPTAEDATRSIPPLTAEVVFYAARESIRNAARYGRNGKHDALLHLTIAVAWHSGLELVIEDDGVGLTANPQPSAEGSGHGLALHSTMMAVVGGTLTVTSEPGTFTRVLLTLPCERESV